MRIVGLEISAVGGLADGYVELPEGPIAALAGANGTGKSKLLACILSPWTSTIPSATEGRIGRVKVDIELTETESVIIEELCRQIGWGNDAVPSTISIITENSALNGQQRTAIPASPFGLGHIWQHGPAMRAAPSLSVVYLPAERRLLPPVTSGIDLNQLTEDLAWQAGTQSRSAVSNYGRLDDQEFEQYAKALCVAAVLPREPGDSLPAADNKARWEEFESTVNSIIDPKKLLGLTSSHPDTLRILTPSGAIHGVQDLSSGERQALIIMSRVLRAGDLHPIIMIDEPDAYLHPNLSKRLIRALGEGVGPSGQLIFATHSPAILDELHVSSILRLEHSSPARAVQSEDERLDVYRRAGFRASALTQSELLVITEGDFDAAVLGHLLPELSGASLRPAGGKKKVLQTLDELIGNGIPVIGVVDLDTSPLSVAPHVRSRLHVWPTADLEGVFLSDTLVLESWLSSGVIKSDFGSVEALKNLINELSLGQKEGVIAELAQIELTAVSLNQWPSSRGPDPIGRLRGAVASMQAPSETDVDGALRNAAQIWDDNLSNPLVLVRGKYILSTFAHRATEVRSGSALIEMAARARPSIAAMEPLRHLIETTLAEA